MTEIERQIAKLQEEQRIIDEKAAHKQAIIDRLPELKDKWYKRVGSIVYAHDGSIKREYQFNANHVEYINFKQTRREDYLDADIFTVIVAPSGTRQKGKELAVNVGYTGIEFKDKYQSYIDISKIHFEKEGLRINGYSSYNVYTECPAEEALAFKQLMISEAKSLQAKIIAINNMPLEEMKSSVDFDLATLLKINDFLASGAKIGDLSVIGKVAKYNYFNADFKLPAMVQYVTYGSINGLSLTIESGDDGTDYEPYVTRYYISNIDIDWLHILYPIRHHLKSVRDTATQLQNCSAVYNTDSWTCVYDTGYYDAAFTRAFLKASVLEQVNTIIKSNLK